jgi:hypothetical protein
MTEIDVRDAGEDDLTRPPQWRGQPGRTSSGRTGADPAYVRHLLRHRRVAVAGRGGAISGFGATRQIGTGAAAVRVLR